MTRLHSPFLASLFVMTGLLALVGCRDTAQPALDDTGPTSETLFPVEQNDQWGYITPRGRLAIQPQFEQAHRFVNNRALVRQDRQYGFIDSTGAVVIEPTYADAWHFSEGLAPVQRDSLWGFIDRTGALVVDPQFELVPSVLEETRRDSAFHRIQVNGQYGYRNSSGTVVIPPSFDQAWYFSEGRARIRDDDRWGFIDRSGNVVIEPRFAQAWDFRNGLARVRLADGRMGYVDTSDTLVWPPDASAK